MKARYRQKYFNIMRYSADFINSIMQTQFCFVFLIYCGLRDKPGKSGQREREKGGEREKERRYVEGGEMTTLELMH